MAEVLLRLPTVAARTGLPRSTIYAKIKEGDFPAPIPLGKRSVAWIESQVDEWIQSRIAAYGSTEAGA